YCLSFFFSSRRRHTRFSRDWSSDVCSSDLGLPADEAFLTHLREYDQWWVDNGLYIDLPDPNVKKLAYYRWFLSRFNYFDGDVPRSEERRVGKGGRARRSRKDVEDRGGDSRC